jgi:hypothetical protein
MLSFVYSNKYEFINNNKFLLYMLSFVYSNKYEFINNNKILYSLYILKVRLFINNNKI